MQFYNFSQKCKKKCVQKKSNSRLQVICSRKSNIYQNCEQLERTVPCRPIVNELSPLGLKKWRKQHNAKENIISL